MHHEPRPTCVTVIGWTWIVLGALMIFSAGAGLLAFAMMPAPLPSDVPAVFKVFPLLAGVQIGVAMVGLISGSHFLKLKAWSRGVLEALTWLLLVFVLGFAVYWIISWVEMTPQQSPMAFNLMGAVMGGVISAIYATPLGIMLWYLRGSKVRNAMEGSTGHRIAS